MIVEEEQNGEDRAGYGEQLLKELSEKLTQEFGRGLSVTNLRNMPCFISHFKNIRHCLMNCVGVIIYY